MKLKASLKNVELSFEPLFGLALEDNLARMSMISGIKDWMQQIGRDKYGNCTSII